MLEKLLMISFFSTVDWFYLNKQNPTIYMVWKWKLTNSNPLAHEPESGVVLFGWNYNNPMGFKIIN